MKAQRHGIASRDATDRISVVIPHLNQPEALQRCLAELFAGKRPPDEVFVVDNGSEILPEAICAAYPDVRLLREPIPGPGPARNKGVAEASGNILAFIDADCRADPDWLSAVAARFTDPKMQILGGDVRIDMEDPARPKLLEAYESVYAYRMDRYIAEQGFTGTGNLAVRREVLDHVGPFAGLQVAEDRDWGRRAAATGYTITYVPEMRAYHPARSDFSELCRKWDRHIAHDFADLPQGPSGHVRWLVKAIAMAFSPLAEIPRILVSDRISGPRARALAVLGLTRIRAYRAREMVALWMRHDRTRQAKNWNRPNTG